MESLLPLISSYSKLTTQKKRKKLTSLSTLRESPHRVAELVQPSGCSRTERQRVKSKTICTGTLRMVQPSRFRQGSESGKTQVTASLNGKQMQAKLFIPSSTLALKNLKQLSFQTTSMKVLVTDPVLLPSPPLPLLL